MAPGPLDRMIRWRPIAGAGFEHCHVIRTDRDTRIRSALVAPNYGVFYRIKLDDAGHVRTLKLDRTDGRTLELFADGAGNWSDDRADPLPALRGCIDIDISATPLTNSLPIWRSEWITGTPQRFSMAWIDTDAMTVHRDDQIYTPLSDTSFLYQAADGSFERQITVDTDGLVLSYPGLFERTD